MEVENKSNSLRYVLPLAKTFSVCVLLLVLFIYFFIYFFMIDDSHYQHYFNQQNEGGYVFAFECVHMSACPSAIRIT